MCCGTGDLTIAMARLAKYNPEITGVDYSQPMLDKAAEKAKKMAGGKNIKFINSEIARLPFPDGWFDCVGISFAFRNLTYKNPLVQEHLDEVLRVLGPGGQYVIVESSQPKSALIRMLDHLYLRLWVFPSGLLISGNKAAYKYLVESAEQFFSAEEAQEFLIKAGFKKVTFRRLFFGAAAVYVATK
jgi:demethylmenaquinone methyltransferase/2-methoxy-6-polyprenyl-1,4-benzoquinol methylase